MGFPPPHGWYHLFYFKLSRNKGLAQLPHKLKSPRSPLTLQNKCMQVTLKKPWSSNLITYHNRHTCLDYYPCGDSQLVLWFFILYKYNILHCIFWNWKSESELCIMLYSALCTNIAPKFTPHRKLSAFLHSKKEENLFCMIYKLVVYIMLWFIRKQCCKWWIKEVNFKDLS